MSDAAPRAARPPAADQLTDGQRRGRACWHCGSTAAPLHPDGHAYLEASAGAPLGFAIVACATHLRTPAPGRHEPELRHGYCVACGLYGVGTFAHVISAYADAIREHTRCRGPAPPDGAARATG
ncbi:hypothetical protein [Kitasatospora sp. NPDC088346]|uniref:hypothetical protein n=1 Tax=Kitasatospora sp. NPDC088346 TaxID=3364073 RepID=UPI0038068136